MALVMMSIALMLIGPVEILMIPSNYGNLVICLGIVGTSAGGIVVILPDMIRDILVQSPYLERQYVSDKASSIMVLGI